MRFLLSLLHRLFGFRKKRTEPSPTISYREIFTGPHDCGLVALSTVMPDINPEKIKEAFMLCCKRWPHAGVNNKDLNIALRYLGIYDCFKYDDSEGQTIGTCMDRIKGSAILLIGGHFLTIKNGKVIDEYNPNVPFRQTKVYFSWVMIE